MLAKKMKRIFAVILAFITLFTQSNMLAFAAETNPNGVAPESVTMYMSNSKPTMGEQVQCWIEVTPADAEYEIVEWWSGNESIATVDQNGLVSTVGIGQTTIYAQVDGPGVSFRIGYNGIFEVFPVYVEDIVISQREATLEVGDTLQLYATVIPENATFTDVTWTSNRENVATVDENGLVTAVGAGTANILAYSTDGLLITDWCVVTVNDPNAEEETGVKLYKNNSLVGRYDTVNEAFDLMTDATADYTVQLCEDQVLYGYAQWPKVNSIKVMPIISYYEYGIATKLYITEKNTTFQSDIIFSESVCVVPNTDSYAVYDMNLQNYEMIFTQEGAGFAPYLGWGSGFHVKGDTGSKVTVEYSAQFFNSSLDVDVLEVVYKEPESGGSAMLTMDSVGRDCKVNTYISEFSPVVGIALDGAEGETVSFEIGNIIFAENPEPEFDVAPSAYIENEGYITVEVKNMPANASLSLRYDSRDAAATGSFSYTGTTLNSIGVSVNMYDANGSGGLRDGEGYQPFKTESVLLYAPNVPSDRIGFSYSLQGNVPVSGNSVGYHTVSLSGSISGQDGYYRTSQLPVVLPSQSVFLFAEDTTKTLNYTYMNGTPKSVTWTAESTNMSDYSSMDVTNQVIGAYDKDSLEITYTNREADEYTAMVGNFDFGNCQIRLVIPLLSSASASNVSLSKEKIETAYYTFDRHEIIINYNASETPMILLSSSDYSVTGNLALSGNTISFYSHGIGTATIRAYVGDEIVECEVVITGVNGWAQAMDGNWYYYKDSEVDTTLNGLAYNEVFGEWWYAVNGKADFSYTGLVYHYGTWYYVENGILNWNHTSLVYHYGIWYYVEKGEINWNKNGLVYHYGTWYYVEKGEINWNKNGLVYHYGTWYYVEKGEINWNKNSLVYHYGTWYYVEKGEIDWNKNGLVYHYGTWYYIEKGEIDWDYTGLAYHYGTWYYIDEGEVNWDYTGLVYHYGTWYYVEKGIMIREV